MKLITTVVVLLSCFVGSAQTVFAQDFGNIKRDQQSFSSLYQKAKNNGGVRVIVTLNTPTSVNKAKVSKGWRSLSAHIADIQSRAMKDLGWVNFNDLVKFKHVAGMTMTVNAERGTP